MDLLSPETLLAAYCDGCFPMANPMDGEQAPINFYSPDPRGIIPLDERFHIPHGLQRTLKKNPFGIRMDTDFKGVISACARTDVPEEQWIDTRIKNAYCRLHDMGFAHSVECWDEDGLQGGLYGIAIGKAFFGESMFHHKTDASKIALVALVRFLRDNHFNLLDIQWTTPHLKTFGAIDIPRRKYLKLLRAAIADATSSSPA